MRIESIIGTMVMLSLAPLTSQAASYEWDGGPTGDFTAQKWLNTTTFQTMSGPPGAGDKAANDEGATLTLQSGSVKELEGNGTFDVEGQFSCQLLDGSPTVMGAGQLTASAVQGILVLKGGRLVADTVSTSQMQVQAGGGVVSHGLFTDPGEVQCSDPGSFIDAEGGMTDVGLQVNAGGHVTASSIKNDGGPSSSVEGSGALLSVTGDLSLAEGATLDVSGGGMLDVGGDLVLDGGKNFFWGGGTWSDPETRIDVGGTLYVGNRAGGFDLTLKNGVQVRCDGSLVGAPNSKGNVVVSGSGTLWGVGHPGLSLGQGGPGTLMVQQGASVVLDSDTAFGVGFSTDSTGSVQVTDPGTVIDARGAQVSIGYQPGSQGSMQIASQSRFVVGQDFFVGDAGKGDLSVFTGAQVSVEGSSTHFGIGNQPGSSGSVSISDAGSSLTTAYSVNTIIGVSNAVSSLLIGNGGSFQCGGALELAASPNSSGKLSVVGKGSSLVAADVFIVGGNGTGLLSVSLGGQVTVPGERAQFSVGDGEGGAGSIVVSDPGSFLDANSDMVIGFGARALGNVTVQNGGRAQSVIVLLGASPGASGTLTITGTNSAWNTSSWLLVGGDPDLQPGGQGAIMLQNGGTLRVGRNCYVSRSGIVRLDKTARMAVGAGDLGPPGSLRVSEGGKLWGAGVTNVQGQIIIGLGGSFKPGGSPGIFSIDGDYLQESGGELDIEIDGTDPGTGYSQVKISGAATLGGTLNVLAGKGFKPQPGQVFQILQAATISGSFTQVNGATVSYGPDGVRLSNVSGSLNTAPPALSIEAVAGHVVVSWPLTASGFTLQGTADLQRGNWMPLPSSANSALLAPTNALTYFRLAQ